MYCFLINSHRCSGSVDGAMLRKAHAHNLSRLLVGDDILEFQFYPFQIRRACVDQHGIIIIQRGIISDAHLDDWVDIAAFFHFTVGISRIPHERSSSEFKIPQIVGMIDNLGAIRIRIQGAVMALMPDQIIGFIPDIGFISIKGYRNKGPGSHVILL